jgi:hypothetical protein
MLVYMFFFFLKNQTFLKPQDHGMRSTRRGSKDTKKKGERQVTRKATNLPAKTTTKQKNKSKNYRGNKQA